MLDFTDMKTKTYLLVTLLMFTFSSSAHATVGGPTYIGDFHYNRADESIYYQVNEQSGRGCPALLYKMSLENRTVTPVIECDQAEAIVNASTNQQDRYYGLRTTYADILDAMKQLSPIALTQSNISIDVEYVSESTLGTGTDSFVSHRNFIANVYQNDTKVDSFEITGCSLNQPFVFLGFAIPGFEKKIIILSSTKSDCFEGGYNREKIHVIGNVSNINKNYINVYKTHYEGLEVSEHTPIVFEKDLAVIGMPVSPTNPTPVDTDSNHIVTALIAVIMLVLGFIVGRFKRSI